MIDKIQEMKMKKYKRIIIISIIINISLVSYLLLNRNHLNNVYSNLSLRLQGDLVQLEGAIDYQIKNDWKEVDTVIEKLEDIREGINFLMVTGKDLGLITKSQENDLWRLYRYFSNFPTYSGYPNTKIDNSDKEKLIMLHEDLRSAGWGMNLGYSSDWGSFRNKINELTK
jgi:hypothetical protein